MVFKGRTIGATLLFAALFGASAHCQQISGEIEIVTDRPDVTESSIVIPKGSLPMLVTPHCDGDHSPVAIAESDYFGSLGRG